MAWRGERRSRWPAETAVKGKSGAAPLQRTRKSKIPAATRAKRAKRKARIIDIAVCVVNEWEERQEDICKEGLGIWVTTTRGFVLYTQNLTLRRALSAELPRLPRTIFHLIRECTGSLRALFNVSACLSASRLLVYFACLLSYNGQMRTSHWKVWERRSVATSP